MLPHLQSLPSLLYPPLMTYEGSLEISIRCAHLVAIVAILEFFVTLRLSWNSNILDRLKQGCKTHTGCPLSRSFSLVPLGQGRTVGKL